MRIRSGSWILAPVALVFLAGCATEPAPPAATDVSAVRDSVESLRNDWVAAAERDDAAAVAQLYSEDAVLMPVGSDAVRGRQAVQDYFAQAFPTASGLQVTSTSFEASGDLAYDAGRFSQNVTPPGGTAMPNTGHYLVVLKQQADGAWRIAHHITAPDTPPPPM